MNLREHMDAIEASITAMEEQAEAEFLERVRQLSEKFPDREVTATGGNGALFVSISPKLTHNVEVYNSRYRFGGIVEYQLDNGGNMRAPEFLRAARDWLFGEMEAIEDDSVIYHFRPMVACGNQTYRNGHLIAGS